MNPVEVDSRRGLKRSWQAREDSPTPTAKGKENYINKYLTVQHTVYSNTGKQSKKHPAKNAKAEVAGGSGTQRPASTTASKTKPGIV